jgi:hypothetical protein
MPVVKRQAHSARVRSDPLFNNGGESSGARSIEDVFGSETQVFCDESRIHADIACGKFNCAHSPRSKGRLATQRGSGATGNHASRPSGLFVRATETMYPNTSSALTQETRLIVPDLAAQPARVERNASTPSAM